MSAIIKNLAVGRPNLDPSVFVAPNAVVTGQVSVGSHSSLWYHAVLRGDVQPIAIGKCTSVQDHVMIHASTNRVPVVIGDYCTIGHRAVLHGCTLQNLVLVGMGAIVLDACLLAEGTVVAAGAVMLEGTRTEPCSLWAGVPARQVKLYTDTPAHLRRLREQAEHYVSWAKAYSQSP